MDNNNPYNPSPYPQQPEHGHEHGHHHGHDNHHHPHNSGSQHQQPEHHPQPVVPAFMQAAPTPPTPVFPPPPAPTPEPVFQTPMATLSTEQPQVMPVPVVRVLSPRGVEYVFMTIVLLTGAFSLGGILLSLVNGETSFEVLSFPAAVLTVCVPIFAWLFLRLKKAELLNPALRLDASKRRSTQFTQIFTFLFCFFTLIGFVATIFAKLSGNFDSSFFKVILDVLVIEAVAGGTLAYYWRDEHRLQ